MIDYVADERLVMRASEGPFPMETRYTCTSTPDDGTHMSLRNLGSPRGFSRWIAPVMVVAMRRASRNDLRLLKRTLEQG